MYIKGKNISFTDRSNSSVDMFLRDIRKSKPLTTEEEYELWQQMRQDNSQAREKLIFSNLRYVVTLAKKYQRSNAPLEDLIMAGSLGLTKVVDQFDASLGNRFISFATKYIESEIQKVAYDHIKHNNHISESLDEPICSDNEDSAPKSDRQGSSEKDSPDWHVCYEDTLHALKKNLDKQYWPGVGEMLGDYLSMKQKGYSDTDFIRKYHLSDQRMKQFLERVRTESRQFLQVA